MQQVQHVVTDEGLFPKPNEKVMRASAATASIRQAAGGAACQQQQAKHQNAPGSTERGRLLQDPVREACLTLLLRPRRRRLPHLLKQEAEERQ